CQAQFPGPLEQMGSRTLFAALAAPHLRTYRHSRAVSLSAPRVTTSINAVFTVVIRTLELACGASSTSFPRTRRQELMNTWAWSRGGKMPTRNVYLRLSTSCIAAQQSKK